MAKPIFIITFPGTMTDEDYKYTNDRLQAELTGDYYVLTIIDPKIESAKFQMFSDKEIEPIELEKLKELCAR